MSEWQSHGSIQPIGSSPAQPDTSGRKRWLVPVLTLVGVVVACGAAVLGSLIGYDKGESSAASSYAALPTPTVTATEMKTVVETKAPVTVIRTETVTETETAAPEVPDTLKLTGSITITGKDNWVKTANGCEGSGGFKDLTFGTSVIVYDGSDLNAGAGSLDESKVDGANCLISFAIDDVVGGSNVYLVEVGTRGKLKAELIGNSLFYSGSIGD